MHYDNHKEVEEYENNWQLEEDKELQRWCLEFKNDRAYDLNNYFPDEV